MQQVWRNRWRSTGWIALATITLVLLISAINKKNRKICTGIDVSFNRDGNNFFIDEKGIVAILKSFSPIKGEPIGDINLKALEERLKNDHWIANAELFFDNKQVLQVILEEKEPVARIFTVSGSSFYIDSSCKRLELSEKLSARIPMFTNFPSDRSTLSRPDSELLASAKGLALFIQGDDFWKAQVSQIDITTGGFEMIPTIGSHVVLLGKDGNWQQKFDRLFSFYKQVWTQVGFEKYEKLDVQFNGQVVATVKGAKPARVDSTKARIAYEKLLAEVKKLDMDSDYAPVEKVHPGNTSISKSPAVSNPVETPVIGEAGKLSAPRRNTLETSPKKTAVKPVRAKAESQKKGSTKQVVSGRVEVKRVPKAIMKRPVQKRKTGRKTG
jgi:cell division protein FtsQ